MAVTETPLTIRVATAADIAPVVALVRSAYRGESSREGWTCEADLLADDRIDEAGLLTKINDPNGVVLMALGKPTPSSSSSSSSPSSSSASAAAQSPGKQTQQEDELLGCCNISRLPEPSKTACFGLFAVRPRLQNGKVGRTILAEAERYAREEMGVQTMEMHVLWMREELRAWYGRRGYALREGDTRPFRQEYLLNGKALRDDLHFVVLEKALV